MHGKRYIDWEFTMNQIRRRKGKEKDYDANTHTGGGPPPPPTETRIAGSPRFGWRSIREGEKAWFSGASIESAHWPGSTKSRKFPGLLGFGRMAEREQCGEHLACSSFNPLPSRPNDENDAQEMTVGPVVVPGASKHGSTAKGAGSPAVEQMSIVGVDEALIDMEEMGGGN